MTARAWLSVLEASYVIFRLPPFFTNLSKRLIKTPKLYFYDAGLAASLLGIDKPEQLATHPLRGALFETWVVAEIVKQHHHGGRRPRLYFYLERGRLEVDLVIERGPELDLVEIKAGSSGDEVLRRVHEVRRARQGQRQGDAWRAARRVVVYGGGESQDRSKGKLLSWSDVDAFDWTLA